MRPHRTTRDIRSENRFSCYLPPDLADEIKNRCTETQVSRSQLLELALRNYLGFKVAQPDRTETTLKS